MGAASITQPDEPGLSGAQALVAHDEELGALLADSPLLMGAAAATTDALIVDPRPVGAGEGSSALLLLSSSDPAAPVDGDAPSRVSRWASAALAPLTAEPCLRVSGAKPLDRDLAARAVLLAALVLAAGGGLVALLRRAPPLETSECAGLSVTAVWRGMFPRMVGGEGDLLGTARRVWLCADAYQRLSPEFVLAVYCATYVGMQAFAIPGPLVLSIIAGALWGALRAQAVIALCATSGATICYGLSHYLARPLIERFLPGSLAETRQKIDGHRDNLLYYLLFLRLTPMVPNWLINVSAPVIGVPLWIFVTATLFGLVPTNYMHALTGSALASLDLSSPTPVRDNWRSMATLAALPVLALVPVLVKRRMAKDAKLKNHSR